MSSVRLAFSSDFESKRIRGPRLDRPVALSSLPAGARGTIVGIRGSGVEFSLRIDRLLAMGVTPGAAVTVLQTFPGMVFLCDQTELAVERAVADAILVRRLEPAS